VREKNFFGSFRYLPQELMGFAKGWGARGKASHATAASITSVVFMLTKQAQYYW
jgi:hypothetical protein